MRYNIPCQTDEESFNATALYYGAKFAFLRRHRMWERERMRWGLSLKVGDYIAACTGYNHVITKIEYFYSRVGRKSRYIDEILITDDRGRWHYLDCSGGCVQKAESVDQIIQYWLSWGSGLDDLEKNGWDPKGMTRTIVQDLKEGKRVFSEHGELLPRYYELSTNFL